jgi:hypothetical protein
MRFPTRHRCLGRKVARVTDGIARPSCVPQQGAIASQDPIKFLSSFISRWNRSVTRTARGLPLVLPRRWRRYGRGDDRDARMRPQPIRPRLARNR